MLRKAVRASAKVAGGRSDQQSEDPRSATVAATRRVTGASGRLGYGRSLVARPAGCRGMWGDHPAVEDQMGLLFPFFVFLMPTRSSDLVSTSIAVIARKGVMG